MTTRQGYQSTLIAAAGDSPATRGTVPSKPGVARFQYGLLHGHPHELTQAEVLFRTAYRDSTDDLDALRAVHWAAFFAAPRACLRASPLPKRFGWGLHFDAGGRVALVPVESAEYARLLDDDAVNVVRAMNTRRAARGAT